MIRKLCRLEKRLAAARPANFRCVVKTALATGGAPRLRQLHMGNANGLVGSFLGNGAKLAAAQGCTTGRGAGLLFLEFATVDISHNGRVSANTVSVWGRQS